MSQLQKNFTCQNTRFSWWNRTKGGQGSRLKLSLSCSCTVSSAALYTPLERFWLNWCTAWVKGFQTSDVWRLPFGRHFYPKPTPEWNSVTELNLLIIQLTKCSFLVWCRRIDCQSLMQSNSQHTSRGMLRTKLLCNSLISLTPSMPFTCITHSVLCFCRSHFCFIISLQAKSRLLASA